MASISLENVSVEFPIYGAQRSFRKELFQRATGGLIRHEGKDDRRVVVEALHDINLTLNKGDRLGLIGHNGAGKSTLLKVLASVYKPTSGTMRVDGKVTPLFDIAPGLDAEDTGYENIITCGMFLGMNRAELRSKLPDIEECSELGEYLTLPVRTYSAGMITRFAFALVTALDPDILIMDEGLTAGDLRFAERAAKRVADFIERSNILVFASHSNDLIEKMCNKAVLMESGRIVQAGSVDEILDAYHIKVTGHPRPKIEPAPDPAEVTSLSRSVG